MLERPSACEAIERALGRAPVVALTGPRQCGKTTLARRFVDPDSVNYFDLESPPSLARLDEPLTALAPLRGLVAIDEVQLRADIFPVLRVLADRIDAPASFLVLGSASGDLLRQTSESLAGRVERVLLGGFTTREIFGQASDAQSTLWRRGGVAACPGLSLPRRRRTAWSGGANTSGPCSSETSPSGASGRPPPPCCASGPCWRTTTAKRGTRPSRHAPWV